MLREGVLLSSTPSTVGAIDLLQLPRYRSVTNSGLPVDAGSGTAVVSMATLEADAGMTPAEVQPAQLSQDVPPKTQVTHWDRSPCAVLGRRWK